MEHTDRMRKARVTGGRKHELRNTELLDPTKTLHIRCVEQGPYLFIHQTVVVKDDEAVDRVPDALNLHQNKSRTFEQECRGLFVGILGISAC